MSFSSRPSFTVIELLVALLVAGILVASTASVYSLFRRTMAADQQTADISQNGRVAMDRLSRELRQTPLVVTDLPNDPTDLSVPQPGSIEFENGHTADLSYYRYYLSGTTLEEDIKYYYFAGDSSTRVLNTAQDAGGNPPLSAVVSTTAIAEDVQELDFYGDGNSVQVDLTTGNGSGLSYQLETTLFLRN